MFFQDVLSNIRCNIFLVKDIRMNVLILGSAGNIGPPGVIPGLEPYHTLRLADIKPHPPEIAARHETMIVDISSPNEVMRAAEGMEAIVNLTVVRGHPVHSFDVNIRGAYNVIRAAVEHGIKRIVHTGPQGVMTHYYDDYSIPSDTPLRYGVDLYGLTKLVSFEICRTFAEAHDLEVVCLLFCWFLDPDDSRIPVGQDTHSFAVSWADTGQIFHKALIAPALPSPFEIFNITSNVPHNRYSIEKARRILDYQPKDDLARLWKRKL
jgi:nucleoside-diphosphate-sugar epimerase